MDKKLIFARNLDFIPNINKTMKTDTAYGK